MTRSARRRRDRVTVDELLRETGATPRKLGASSAASAVFRDPEAGSRLERRVEEATGGGRRFDPRTRRRALVSGAGVMAGGLVVLVLVSGRSPADQQPALPFVQLPPATGPLAAASTEPPAPVSSATPSPVVMSATRTKPKVVIPPAPVITTDVPPPSTPVTTVTFPDPYGGYCYNYPYCGPYGGGYHR